MLILDTHVWLRRVFEGGRTLPPAIKERIRTADNIAVSAISCFEIALLVRKRRLVLPLPPAEWIAASLSELNVECLPVSCKIARISAELPEHHKDPADRIIIATAMIHQATLASLDRMFIEYAEIAPLLLRE